MNPLVVNIITALVVGILTAFGYHWKIVNNRNSLHKKIIEDLNYVQLLDGLSKLDLTIEQFVESKKQYHLIQQSRLQLKSIGGSLTPTGDLSTRLIINKPEPEFNTPDDLKNHIISESKRLSEELKTILQSLTYCRDHGWIMGIQDSQMAWENYAQEHTHLISTLYPGGVAALMYVASRNELMVARILELKKLIGHSQINDIAIIVPDEEPQ